MFCNFLISTQHKKHVAEGEFSAPMFES